MNRRKKVPGAGGAPADDEQDGPMIGHLKHLFAALTGPAVLAIAWSLVSYSGGSVRATYLPGPHAVALALGSGILEGALLREAWTTLGHFTAGFTIAATLGMVVGAVIGRFRRVGTAVQPVLNFLRTLPAIALLPVFVLIIGLDSSTIVAVSAYASVWFVLLNTAAGIQGVDPVILDTARVFGARGWKRWWKVILPSAAPRIATGLRLGLGIALVAAVGSSMILATNGLGYVIYRAVNTMHPADGYAAIIVLGALAWIVFSLGDRIERWLVPWSTRL